MKLILLGTGTSTGVPEVACGCLVCQSQDSRDKRQRSSALLVTNTGGRILIDCGPDFRQQANYIGLDRIDAILLTHEHYDHVYGLDDLRTLAWRDSIPIYGQRHVLEAVRSRMHYAFGKKPYPGTARLELQELPADGSVEIAGVEISPIVVQHGKLPIYGYKFRDLMQPEYSVCYITDMKSIAPQEWTKVEGSQLLVINALRYKKEHPSHQSIVDVQMLIEGLKYRPKLTVLTHLSHHAPCHRDMEGLLPEDLRPAYDYMCITCQDGCVTSAPFRQAASVYNYTDLDKLSVSLYQEGAWDMERLLDYICRENSCLCLATSPDEREVLCAISLSPVQYPIEDSFLEQALYQALVGLLANYQIPKEHLQSCILLRRLREEGITAYVMILSVNHGEGSLYSLGNSPKPIDTIVLKAQLTASIYRQMKELIAPQFRSSLLDD